MQLWNWRYPHTHHTQKKTHKPCHKSGIWTSVKREFPVTQKCLWSIKVQNIRALLNRIYFNVIRKINDTNIPWICTKKKIRLNKGGSIAWERSTQRAWFYGHDIQSLFEQCTEYYTRKKERKSQRETSDSKEILT